MRYGSPTLRPMRTFLLSALLLGTVIACGDGLSERLTGVEERLDALQAEDVNESVPIVVRVDIGGYVTYGRSGNLTKLPCGGTGPARASWVTVEWAIAGGVFEGCWALDSPCAQQAEVGSPLPAACRTVSEPTGQGPD